MIQKQKIVAKYHQFFLHFSFLTASKIVLSVAPDVSHSLNQVVSEQAL
jgi:hypothetical protein